MPLKDLTGKRFGRLVVVSRCGINKNRSSTWTCVCDCGNKIIVASPNLVQGRTRSCGCLKNECITQLRRTHGKTKTRLFSVWQDMIRRCNDKQNHAYKNYGGRGIFVCNDWIGKDGFQNFWDWAYANGYDDNASTHQCTIDRIDNDGPYAPWNCRWANNKIQCNNNRRNRVISFGGITGSMKFVCETLGYDYQLINGRVQHGWDIERAFTEPPKRQTKKQHPEFYERIGIL